MGSASPTTSSDARSLAAAFRPGRTALIPYLTAGFPSPARTPALLNVLADAGADIIELGIPFSDPLADGATIQRAMQAALEEGASLTGALDALAAFRATSEVPVVLFSYLNPVLSYGVDRFIEDAAAAGADGLLLTDLPVGGDARLETTLEASPLDLIRLIAPTTSPQRALEIARRAQGFVYYISRAGVTGARTELPAGLAAEVRALREAAGVPVAVGFGISTPEQAAEVGSVADGVVVGSALIEVIEREGEAGLAEFVASLRQ